MFKPKKNKKKERIILIVFFVIILAGASYLFFFTEIAKISKIEIKGSDYFKEEEAKELLGSPAYIFSPIEIGELPMEIKEANFKRNYFTRKISLEIKERSHYAMWCFDEGEIKNCKWFDEDGLIFTLAPFSQGNFIKVIFGDRKVEIGENILPENNFKNLKGIFDIMERNKFSIESYQIENSKNEEITAYISGTPIYLSLRINPEFIEKALNSLKDEIIRISYIDLRSENRAFYKNK